MVVPRNPGPSIQTPCSNTQIFQKPLTKVGSLNHIATLLKGYWKIWVLIHSWTPTLNAELCFCMHGRSFGVKFLDAIITTVLWPVLGRSDFERLPITTIGSACLFGLSAGDERVKYRPAAFRLILSMIEILHGFKYQNPRTYGSMVHMGSCRVCIINSSSVKRRAANSSPPAQSRQCHEILGSRHLGFLRLGFQPTSLKVDGRTLNVFELLLWSLLKK